jgi:arginine utilization protein RocB
MNPDRTRELALALTAFPSITDSDGETRFAFFLRDLLAGWPYFKANPDRIALIRTLDDPRERYVLVASIGLSVGAAIRPAVILTGHYDVVSVDNYGTLAPWAFEPDALAPQLASALEAESASGLGRGARAGETERKALADLRSGEFLPGRGLLDMKAGLAAGLALFEDRANEAMNRESPGRTRTAGAVPHEALVFLVVPDEEGSSHGMLSAVRALPAILESWGLKALAAINLDAAVDQGDGAAGRAAFLGSVGKLHPFALFIGRTTHAGAPFDGLNPALLAADFARGVECATNLFDQPVTADSPPPPTILYYRELRDHYDVTTPSSVFVSVNVLTHRDGPEAVLGACSRLALESMHTAVSTLRLRADAFSSSAGQAFSPPDHEPRTVSWAELAQSARVANQYAYEAAELKARSSADRIPALAEFVAAAALMAGFEGPVAVVGLAPPYYPRAALEARRDEKIITAVEHAVSAMAESTGQSIAVRQYFPGISDMSFLNPCDDADARLFAATACPLGLDPLPSGFSCPVMNIGPWGREYHQRLERVHAGYAFEVLPVLLERTVAEIFKRNAEN